MSILHGRGDPRHSESGKADDHLIPYSAVKTVAYDGDLSVFSSEADVVKIIEFLFNLIVQFPNEQTSIGPFPIAAVKKSCTYVGGLIVRDLAIPLVEEASTITVYFIVIDLIVVAVAFLNPIAINKCSAFGGWGK